VTTSQANWGDGTTTAHLTPVDVKGLVTGVVAVTAGGHFNCALTTGGGVQCWGDNAFGQLGDGKQKSERSTAKEVKGLASGVAAVVAGGGHTCGLTTGGGVKCWGLNEEGQLGDGTKSNRTTPTAVAGLESGVTGLAAGIAHTCAVTSAGGVKCWGTGRFGSLGDGTGGVANDTCRREGAGERCRGGCSLPIADVRGDDGGRREVLGRFARDGDHAGVRPRHGHL